MIQKFSEASQQMNPGDIFRAHDVNVNDIKLNSDGNSFNSVAESGRGALVMFSKEYLQLQGEIIRAEPEVLTVDDYIQKYNVGEDEPDTHGYYLSNIIDGFEDGDKNGQNKEYKRLKAHMEKFKTRCEILENLTPPWEPEK